MIPVRILLETEHRHAGSPLMKHKYLYRGQFLRETNLWVWHYDEKDDLGGGEVLWTWVREFASDARVGQTPGAALQGYWRMERRGSQPLEMEFRFPAQRQAFLYPTPYGEIDCWYMAEHSACSGLESWDCMGDGEVEGAAKGAGAKLELDVQYLLGMGVRDEDPLQVRLHLQVRAGH